MLELIGKILSFFGACLGRVRDAITRDKTLSQMQAQMNDLQAHVTELLGIVRDMKHNQLRRIESDVALLMELVTSQPSDAVFLTDAHGETYWLSPSYMQITGLTMDQARHEGWLRAVIPDDRQSVAKQWRDAISENAVFVADYTFQNTSTRERISVHCDAQPVFRSDSRQSVIGWVGRLTKRQVGV